MKAYKELSQEMMAQVMDKVNRYQKIVKDSIEKVHESMKKALRKTRPKA